MITLNTKVRINKSHILTINLPKTIKSGEYDALLVLDKNNKKQEPIWFPDYSFNIESHNSFRREDMFGENGRCSKLVHSNEEFQPRPHISTQSFEPVQGFIYE